METVPSDGQQPAATEMTEDTGVLVVAEDDDDFESLYDVPYVTVNRMDGQIIAEVIFSGCIEVDRDRIATALKVGQEYGFRAYSRVFGHAGQVLIYFSDNPLGGIIYGPLCTEEILGHEWSE